MKLMNVQDVNDFMAAIEKSKDEVWLESVHGDKISLKSPLSRYVAIGELVKKEGSDLELFCSQADQHLFLQFFHTHPGTSS